MSIRIRSNFHYYELQDWYSLPKQWQDWFDYVTDEEERFSQRFFCYRNHWYDSHEFSRIHSSSNYDPHALHNLPEDSPFHEWQGYQSDSFFSGIVLRWPDECESEKIQVGTYMTYHDGYLPVDNQ